MHKIRNGEVWEFGSERVEFLMDVNPGDTPPASAFIYNGSSVNCGDAMPDWLQECWQRGEPVKGVKVSCSYVVGD